MSEASFDKDKLFPGKFFISTALDLVDTKTEMSGKLYRRYIQRAAMAGIIIGIFYVADYAVVAGFDALGANQEFYIIGKLLGSAIFGWALVFIYYSKSELLTSSMMIVAIGQYFHRVKPFAAARILGLCYLGNIIGGLVIAGLLRGTTLINHSVLQVMRHTVGVKTSYLSEGYSGWLDLFIRAILCNLMINLAMLLVYNGYLREDIAKCMAMVMAVFVFAFLDFEHSVANSVLFLIVGMHGGVPIGEALGNLVIVLLGNFVGGGVLIGFYYAWVNDERDHGLHLRRRSDS